MVARKINVTASRKTFKVTIKANHEAIRMREMILYVHASDEERAHDYAAAFLGMAMVASHMTIDSVVEVSYSA